MQSNKFKAHNLILDDCCAGIPFIVDRRLSVEELESEVLEVTVLELEMVTLVVDRYWNCPSTRQLQRTAVNMSVRRLTSTAPAPCSTSCTCKVRSLS